MSRIERGKNVRENDIAPAGIRQGSTRTEKTPARTASSASFSRRASSTGTLRMLSPRSSPAGSLSGPAASSEPASWSDARCARCASWNASEFGVGPLTSSAIVNSSNSISVKRLARLEQGLQAAEHCHPADTGDGGCRLRCALEPVVDDREQARSVVLRLDLPRDAALVLVCKLGAVARTPAVHELARRVVLVDRLVAPDVAARAERRVVVRGDRDARAVEVALGELRLGYRLPDRLGRRLDDDVVDLRRLHFCRRRHAVLLQFVLEVCERRHVAR